MDFTALGDTVNTAARTESVNKYFGTRLAATEEIASKCSSDLKFLPIGDIVLKGKTIAVPLYNPVSSEFFNSEYSKQYLDIYNQLKESAVDSNLTSDNDDGIPNHPAGNKMIKLSRKFPNEPLAKFHANRITEGLITTKVIMDSK
jgi:adenylate cyclase